MPIEKLTGERILELFRQGYTVERIKKEFGGSKDRIRKFRPNDQSSDRPTDPLKTMPVDLFRKALKQGRIGIQLKAWMQGVINGKNTTQQ